MMSCLPTEEVDDDHLVMSVGLQTTIVRSIDVTDDDDDDDDAIEWLFLDHKHNRRCFVLSRGFNGFGTKLKKTCKVPNNWYLSDTRGEHTFHKVEVNHTDEATQVMISIGVAIANKDSLQPGQKFQFISADGPELLIGSRFEDNFQSQITFIDQNIDIIAFKLMWQFNNFSSFYKNRWKKCILTLSTFVQLTNAFPSNLLYHSKYSC